MQLHFALYMFSCPSNSTFVQNLSLRLADRSKFNFPPVSLLSSLTQHAVLIPRIALWRVIQVGCSRITEIQLKVMFLVAAS